MKLKRIIKEEIDDSLDWIKDTPEVTIGGKNGLPIESVPLGTKIVAPNGHVFTMEDVTGFHMPHQFVWGSDLESPWLGPKNDEGNKNWHNALWLRKATTEDLNESKDFEWTDSISDRPLHNVTFKVKGYPETLYTIKDNGLRSSVNIAWRDGSLGDFDYDEDGITKESAYMRDAVNKYFKIGEWIPTEGPITESKDLEWIQDTQPGKKDIINFNKKIYKTTLDYDDIKLGDKFIPPGSHHIWTVDDMYEWGVSKRDYRFMVWLKNDKGSIRRKIYNRGNKFPGDYRPWRKIVNEQIKESNEEWDWAKDITPVELEDPKEWVGRSFGYGPEIIDEMSSMEIEMGDDKEYYTIDSIDVNGNLSLTRHHPNRAPNSDSTTSVYSLRDYISNGRWVWK